MKTQAELKAHYRDVIIPMVAKYNYDHGTDVKPWECVKLDGRIMICHPKFEYKPDIYTFAITILEGKPVFVGDRLYANNCTQPLMIKGNSEQSGYLSVGNCTNYDISILSWTPPIKKRTFMFGDKELPCPDKNKGGYQISLISSRHFFSDFHDAQKVANAIDAILTEARDKE